MSTSLSGIDTRGTHGLLSVASDSQLAKLEAEAEREEKKKATSFLTNLASFVRTQYQANAQQKQTVQREMLDALRQREGLYDETKRSALERLGIPTIFLKYTDVKCRAAEAWFSEIMGNAGQPPFFMESTPIPDIPMGAQEEVTRRTMQEWAQARMVTQQPIDPVQIADRAAELRDKAIASIKEYADEAAGRMQKKVWDQMVEGGWIKAFNDFISDLTTFHVGVMKGPIIHKRVCYKWAQTKSGKWKRRKVIRYEPHYYAVNPQDIYPSSDSTNCQDGTNIIEKTRYIAKDLEALRDEKGYSRSAINRVLAQFGMTGYRMQDIYSYDSERDDVENRDAGGIPQWWDLRIDGIEMWGSIPGWILLDWANQQDGQGIEDFNMESVDAESWYECEVHMAGEEIIKAMPNQQPNDLRPYMKTSYAISPGSFWGKGIPQLMDDLQKIMNACGRSMVTNMGMAAGPQVAILDINKIPHGQESLTHIYPLKVWQFASGNLPGSQEPIKFFNVQSNANELMGILQSFVRMADDITGIPAYAYGNAEGQGALRTSSGLGMLMNSAARGVRKVIARVYEDIYDPIIKAHHDYNMENDPDDSLKGDVLVHPQGIMRMIMREQSAQQIMTALQATANPIDSALLGPKVRLTLLREWFRDMRLPEEELPTIQDLLDRERQQMEMQARALAQEQARAQGAQPGAAGPEQQGAPLQLPGPAGAS